MLEQSEINAVEPVDIFTEANRIVVKIGSALLTDDGKGLDEPAIGRWVAQMAALVEAGKELIIVSSGSVAVGMTQLGMDTRPESLSELQAAAAVGQMGLVQTWQSAFNGFGIKAAQVLLVHDDLRNRKRYLNARNTLQKLLDLGVVPIVNENDTVATDEIRFGDNDTLAAVVANTVDADALVILTDQDAMYTGDPRKDVSAEPIRVARADDKALLAMAGGGGKLGRGGMTTKVEAARLAARSGTSTVIVGGRIEQVIQSLVLEGQSLGTLLLANQKPLEARKLWLASLPTDADIQLDDGAVSAVVDGGNSVLPVGVKAIAGEFAKGAMVNLLDASGRAVAKGLINYSSEDSEKLLGKKNVDVLAELGYQGASELVHYDNLIVY